MKFYSTNKKTDEASLEEAVLKGLAPDGGLYMPLKIPILDSSFFLKLSSLSFHEIAFEVGKAFFAADIPDLTLRKIIEEAFTFDAPLVPLSDQIYSLELFHGPTLSFKDFGARFMSRLITYLIRNKQREITVLVATSGDTGSAVAHGFLGVPGIRVWVLYPKGQVSLIQEKQLTTMGQNVTALEVEGSFDDCQALVKTAFNDPQLTDKIELTSANSINIGRLIPQSFYYFYAYAQLKGITQPVAVSVPSGNFGNLTAGLFAKKMGLPIHRFIAATNINDSVPRYLQSGNFITHPSKQTISNAMDVGNPSNFRRILDLNGNDIERIRQEIFGVSFTDDETRAAIKEIERDFHYLADPHGAVAYLGVKAYQQQQKTHGIFLETAHPAKFLDIVEPLLAKKIEIPERLQEYLDKPKKAILLSNRYCDLKDLLLGNTNARSPLQ